MGFTCCFLNCSNLIAPTDAEALAGVGPETVDTKIAGIAATLRRSVGGDAPDLIGLCEVGSEALGSQVAEQISDHGYSVAWSGGSNQSPGLMVIYNTEKFTLGRAVTDTDTRGDQARVKWFAVKLVRREPDAPLWFIVHHWHSPLSGEEAQQARINLWGEFNSFYKRHGRIEADGFIVVGDFNCEPGDRPLVRQPDQVLVTTRERELAKRGLRDGLFLYNPMWRFMGEEHPYERTLEAGYSSSRPIGTYLKRGTRTGWRMLDQLFVSRAMLVGPYFRLIEGSVAITEPVNACSDHSAIAAKFQDLEV
jgi:hypothetical protein